MSRVMKRTMSIANGKSWISKDCQPISESKHAGSKSSKPKARPVGSGRKLKSAIHLLLVKAV